MGGTAPQAVQAEAGRFQRDFFSVPLTDARVRGKRDHGSVKTTRADSNTLGLDLRLFLESARGYSFPREKNSLSHPRTHRLPTHPPSKRNPPYGDGMVSGGGNRPSSRVDIGGSISMRFL